MERLDKFLCDSGVGTRSQVKLILKAGRVAVDGRVEKDNGRKIDPSSQRITLDGEVLGGKRRVVVMLNKPAGLLTAARDKKQPTVMDLLPDVYSAIGCMPVGRLDKDTTGLLFLTTDGELNHRLLSPGRHVDKTYLAEVDGPLDDSHVAAFIPSLIRSYLPAP